MGVDWFAMVFGLGFVLSFGYWCTNFLVVQRAMAARNMSAARRTPLIAALPKMLLPALVIVPGMIAIALASIPSKNYTLPKKPVSVSEAAFTKGIAEVKNANADMLPPADAASLVGKAMGVTLRPAALEAIMKQVADNAAPETIQASLKAAVVAENDYDSTILSLVKKYCPSGLLGLALTALLASFMSGMAGNVTAFNTVWTYDLYQAYFAPNKTDQHYAWMGRFITVVGIVLSIGAAYLANNWANAMDIIQLVFGFVNAPLFATFLLGMFWARTTGTGAFLGLIGGTGTSALFHALTLAQGNTPGIKGAYLASMHEFPSDMAQNFWLATFAFLVCFGLTLVISLATKRTKSDVELKGLVYSLTPKLKDDEQAWYLRPAVIGVLLLIGCVILNFIFW
jgi:SSS family solute:Na+ symporter